MFDAGIDAERALLGLFMLRPDEIWRHQIPVWYWAEPRHHDIYAAIYDLAADTGAADLPAVASLLDRRGKLSEIGGKAYLAKLLAAAGSSAESLIAVMRESAMRRAILRAAYTLKSLGEEPVEDLATLAGQTIDTLLETLADDAAAKVSNLREVALRRAQDITSGQLSESVPTGLTVLDAKTGGLPRGELTVLAGRPGMGKSALAHQIIAEVASRGEHVLLCSPEMSSRAVADRFLARMSGLSLSSIRTMSLGNEAKRRLREAAGEIPGTITIYDEGSMTTQSIRGVARMCHARQRLSLIVVDHLQYLSDPQRHGESRNNLVGRMARNLKNLGRALNCPVLLLSQLSRAVEQREKKIPTLADLRDSGEIEQDADTVLLLYREGYYKPDSTHANLVHLIIAKQRNGVTGTEYLTWLPATASFAPAELQREVLVI